VASSSIALFARQAVDQIPQQVEELVVQDELNVS
jgi:hypothetical protein